jgi:hypothetical protein
VSINVSTSTDFKGTLIGDPTTGVVRVTNAHPAGTYRVTVTAFESGGANATKMFTLIVTTPVTCNEASFAAATNFAAGDGPAFVAVGDFNGDGNQDVALTTLGFPGNVSILLGDGAGHFSAPTNFTVGDSPVSIAVGDFNGDGKQDLAVANTLSSSVSIRLGDGAGNFGPARNFSVDGDVRSMAMGDFNGDGNQDLATAGGFSDNVSILLGDGTGSFSGPTNFSTDLVPSSVAMGDFNGDGKQDLVTVNLYDTASILLGDGAGNFGAPTNFAVGDFPQSVRVGDFNGDGEQDLAVANGIDDNMSILISDCMEVRTLSQITPAGTTCSQFSSRTAETLDSVQYDLNSGLIHRVNPRAFLYWAAVTVPAGNNIFTITQTITTGNFNTFFTAIVNGSNVFDSDCVSMQRAITQSGGTVTVRFNAPVAGTYYIAIKYNTQSLSGEPAPNPGTTVHYDFMTTGVPGSTSGLDLVRYQSP